MDMIYFILFLSLIPTLATAMKPQGSSHVSRSSHETQELGEKFIVPMALNQARKRAKELANSPNKWDALHTKRAEQLKGFRGMKKYQKELQKKYERNKSHEYKRRLINVMGCQRDALLEILSIDLALTTRTIQSLSDAQQALLEEKTADPQEPATEDDDCSVIGLAPSTAAKSDALALK